MRDVKIYYGSSSFDEVTVVVLCVDEMRVSVHPLY